MTKYRNQNFMLDDDIDIEEEDIVVPENAPPEEKSFAKRYGDLRRHSQAQATEANRKIKELENRIQELASNQMELPTSEEDIEAWVKKYPDVSKIVIGIARQQAQSVTADIDARVAQLDARELDMKKAEAQAKLQEKHPDFFTVIRSDPDFHEWLEEQGEEDRAALYDNDTDWRSASKVIAAYKYEKGINSSTTTKKPDTRKQAASAVDVRGGATPSASKGHLFTESQIAKMHPKEYDRLEAEIEKAMREGKVLFDMTGGAR